LDVQASAFEELTQNTGHLPFEVTNFSTKVAHMWLPISE